MTVSPPGSHAAKAPMAKNMKGDNHKNGDCFGASMP